MFANRAVEEASMTATNRSFADNINPLLNSKYSGDNVSIPGKPGDLLDKAWKQFDPRYSIGILLDSRDSFTGHKEVLFSGLCAWVASPNDSRIIRHAMVIQSAQLMASAEDRVMEMMASGETMAIFVDFAVRLQALGIDYLNEIYYAFGGADSILNAPSDRSLRARLKRQGQKLADALTLVDIIHYVQENLATPEYRPASLNTARKLVHRVGGTRGDRQCDTIWREFRPSLALAYAASSLWLRGGSLLDRIIKGRASFRTHGKLLPEWLARAKHAEQIIKQIQEKSPPSRLLPGGKISRIDPPDTFSDEQTAHIRDAFRRKGK